MRIIAIVLGAAVSALGQTPGGGAVSTDRSRALAQRLQQTDPKDAAAVLATAQWCEKQQLWQPAGKLYRHVLNNLDPAHEAAYNGLMQVTLTHGLFDPPGRKKTLQGEFGPSFGLYESDYFLVVHDRPKAWAASRARMLELTRKRFLGVLSRADFRPLPLGERLVCLSFARYNDFLAYARRADHHTGDWFRGYYSSRTNRIAFFDVESDPKLIAKSQRVGQLQQRAKELTQQIGQAERSGDAALAQRLRNARRVVQRQANEQASRWRQVRGLTNIAHAIHEATHQLAYNTGIQKRGVTYPMWFSEGLATSFETITPAAPFGPTHDNPQRRAAFLDAANNKKTLDYSRFVGTAAPPTENEEMIGTAYAQSWALFVYLYNEHPQALRRYCFFKRAQSPGRLGEAELRSEFEKHFGNPEAIGPRVAKYIFGKSQRR